MSPLPEETNNSVNFFRSADELISCAKRESEKAEELYQASACLYYIGRYMVSLYEATFSTIPIQVWNEYRSALDHHMRYLTLPDRSNHKQITHMEGHLQRAVLDVCKLFIHETFNKLDYKISVDSVDLLRMVDSGNFYKEIRCKLDETKSNFAGVKTQDKALGNQRATDSDIINQYLDVAFKARNLIEYYNLKGHDIEVANQMRSNILHEGKSSALKEIREPWYKKLQEHIFGHTVYGIIIVVLTLIVKSWF